MHPSHFDIISFPGPVPPLDKNKLKNLQFDVRQYRNRRVGEFLKELHLTEGRATGIPTILKSLRTNGSPDPVFETDDQRTYFKTVFYVHHEFKPELTVNKDDVGTKPGLSWDQVGTKLALSRQEAVELFRMCKTAQAITVLMNLFNWKDRTKFKKKFINPAIKLNLLSMTLPDKPSSPNQKYILTDIGKLLLEDLENKED